MEELTQDGGAQLARTMLMAAAQLVESVARVQVQRAWMAQNRSTAQAAQAQQQIAAERDAARMIFRPLTEDRYWRDFPQLDRVVQAYITALSWAEHDPEARVAVGLIKQHAEERWGRAEAMRVPDTPGADHDHALGDTSLTAKQRQFLVDLGVQPNDDLTKVEASEAIRQRLQVASPDDNSRHHAEGAVEEGIARQGNARQDRGEQASSLGDPAAMADAQDAHRQSAPAIARPIQPSLRMARRSEGIATSVDAASTSSRGRHFRMP